MKFLGIVGTSHLSEKEKEIVKDKIMMEICRFAYENSKYIDDPFSDIGIITGDAEGVDSIVWEIVKSDNELRKNSRRYESTVKTWDYFKQRNIAIATASDKVICITTPIKVTQCYHCNDNHERTGGCWTMKYAKGLNKTTQLIVI